MPHVYKSTAIFLWSICICCIILLAGSLANAQTTYVVTSTADSPDADLTDNICADSQGNCTLRAAIENANLSMAKDKVHFNLAGTGPFKFYLAVNLPKITQPIELDATTQPGYAPGVPLILIDGSNLPVYPFGTSVDLIPVGFHLKENSAGSLIKGFVIGGFGKAEVDEEGKIIPGTYFAGFAIYGETAAHTIQGNFIGVAADGKTPFPNSWGISLYRNKTLIGGPNTADRNIVSGQWQVGIQISPNADSTQVIGNYIGTSVDGKHPLGNFSSIQIVSKGNLIQGNLISGSKRGIHITGGASKIVGNHIGVDADGASAIPNDIGIIVDAANNQIGAKGQGNLISGNRQGVLINSFYNSAVVNSLVANFIGTDKSGTKAIPNEIGIYISGNESTSNYIGGLYNGDGNLISGNLKEGILIGNKTSNNYVYGNIIGTKADCKTPLPNGGNGIHISESMNNFIGSPGLRAFNIIAYNGANGILVSQNATTYSYATSNKISANQIFSNALQGIDLAGDGITANDRDDADVGPNQLQNFPVLSDDAASNGSDLSISYTVPSGTRHAAYPLRVEFFIADGSRQGKVFLHADQFTEMDSKSKGKVKQLSFKLPEGVSLTAGNKIVATATDAWGNSSEFAAAVGVQVSGGCTSPTTYYADADGDGYGVDDAATNIESCDHPGEGYSTLAGDCDDTDPSIHEHCQGSDACLGAEVLILEQCTDATAKKVYWLIRNPASCSAAVRWEVQKGEKDNLLVEAQAEAVISTSLAAKGPTKVTFYWNDSQGLETKITLTANGLRCPSSNNLRSSLEANEANFQSGSTIMAYPNPLKAGGLWIELPASSTQSKVALRIYDLRGRLMAEESLLLEKEPSKYFWALEHSRWASGMYILKLSGEGLSQQLKIIK
jgi:CSLREA domain-containing protein